MNPRNNVVLLKAGVELRATVAHAKGKFEKVSLLDLWLWELADGALR